jgi:hypothetical protein
LSFFHLLHYPFRFSGEALLQRTLQSLVLPLLLSVGAVGQTPGNRAYVGQDVFVAPGQQVHNATCLFCSVQVEGELTGRVIVLFGNLNVSGQVEHNATVIGGNVIVDSQARIGGDTVIVGGNAVYEADESLSGSAYVLGGHLSHFARGAKSGGRSRMSLSPRFSWLLGVIVLVLLSAFIAPRVRRSVVGVTQST